MAREEVVKSDITGKAGARPWQFRCNLEEYEIDLRPEDEKLPLADLLAKARRPVVAGQKRSRALRRYDELAAAGRQL